MIGLVVDTVRAAGFRPTVVVSKESDGVRSVLGDTVSYAVQDDQLGTGHALLQADGLLPFADNVLVINGDVPLLEPSTLTALAEEHSSQGAAATIATATLGDPGDLGRVVRDASGRVTAVVEKADADDVALGIREVNGGLYCFDASWLWPSLRSISPSASGEIYLTDLVEAATSQGRRVATVRVDDPDEIAGVNTRLELSRAEAVMRRRINERLMLTGTTIEDPATTYIDHGVSIGMDTTIHPNTHITGDTTVGEGCEIGPNAVVDASVIGDRCSVAASVVRGANLEDGVSVGAVHTPTPGDAPPVRRLRGQPRRDQGQQAGSQDTLRPLLLHWRRSDRRRCQYRCRDRYVQLRWTREAPHPHRGRCADRVRLHACCPGQDRRPRVDRRGGCRDPGRTAGCAGRWCAGTATVLQTTKRRE